MKDISFICASFILYSTVIDIKKLSSKYTSEEEYLIVLNSKDGKNEIIIHNKLETHSVYSSKQIIRDCLMIDQ